MLYLLIIIYFLIYFITVIYLFDIVVIFFFFFNLLYVGSVFTGFAVHSPFFDLGKRNLNTACPVVVVVVWSRSAFSL